MKKTTLFMLSKWKEIIAMAFMAYVIYEIREINSELSWLDSSMSKIDRELTNR